MTKICPRCGSKDISPDFSKESYGKGTFFNSWKCNKCGYKGQFFIEIEKNKIKENKEQNNACNKKSLKKRNYKNSKYFRDNTYMRIFETFIKEKDIPNIVFYRREIQMKIIIKNIQNLVKKPQKNGRRKIRK